MCPTLMAIEKLVDELLFYHLTFHTARTFFNPYNKIRMVVGEKHKHKIQLEDYWANARDDFKVRKRMFFGLPLNLIRLCEVIQVPDQVQEDENMVQPKYEKERDRPIRALAWSEPKVDDLNILSRLVLKFTRHWVEQCIAKLKANNTCLTYQLMGDLDSHIEATKGSSGV